MHWNNDMLFPEMAFLLNVAQNISLIGMAAYLLTRLPAFQRTLSSPESSLFDKLLLGCVCGLISAAGNWIGIPVHGAIANTRIVGAIVGGLVGGPLVGLIAGTIGAFARYFMGGFTVWPAMLSNIIVGVFSGFVYSKYGSQGISVQRAFVVSLISEAILKIMILTMAKPFEAAWKLEQMIGLPTMIGNSLAVVFFIYIFRDIIKEQQKKQAFSAQQAIRMIQKISDSFRVGLNEQSAHHVAEIIYTEMKPAAAAVTDTEKVLAFIGKGADHHKPGTLILTEATKLAVSRKQSVLVSNKADIGCPHESCELSAVIDVPVVVLGELAGTIKVYKTGNEQITLYEVELIKGIADSLGVQLAQQRFEQQQLTLLQTEYSMLKAQINPHFFYNTLSTIQSLVRNDAGAVSLIKDLADFFRKTLKQGNEMVHIKEELDSVTTYFRIEKARFRDRVNLTVTIPDNLQEALIPNFTLQPLVENAIRHGISMKRGGGTITVSVCTAGDKLRITIADDGIGMTADRLEQVLDSNYRVLSEKGTGIGVGNVNQRLRKLFGPKYGLSITSEQGTGTTIVITLPLMSGGNRHAKTTKSDYC